MPNSDQLPKHVPIDMAIAPDQKPYKNSNQQVQRPIHETNKLAQHSLSPEKLGVVGYVKDVAGFVKDVVTERRHKKQTQVEHSNQHSEIEVPNEYLRVEPANNSERRSSISSQENEKSGRKSPLVGVVASLFPGTNQHIDGCIHADELRQQMLQVNEQQELIHKS